MPFLRRMPILSLISRMPWIKGATYFATMDLISGNTWINEKSKRKVSFLYQEGPLPVY